MSTAISDTCMFFFGMCIGISFNYVFQSIVNLYNITKRRHLFPLGIVQILLNALVIRYVREHVQNIGLFTLGILSSQSLLIKKCYPEL
jgi:uncharacterized membrane protein